MITRRKGLKLIVSSLLLPAVSPAAQAAAGLLSNRRTQAACSSCELISAMKGGALIVFSTRLA